MDEPEWLSVARDMVGIREIKGSVHEPLILRLWALAGMGHVKDDETAWCAAFVGGVLETAGIRCTRKPNARSYCDWGIDCLESGPLEAPLGAVIVFSRPPSEWMGHVGFAVGQNKAGQIIVMGGNQRDRVGIDPFETGRVIAARWPVEKRTDLRLLRKLPMLNVSGPASTGET